ncbi:serine/threonine-protein phosphatase 6 regulatory ankyrin repeat subunit B-like, partial [Haliotis rufescens]|uniref:serine/threonine-protein phosphatase 6 regulatory ankyrin repeat subunit B-like n=1 Tax=Haliotis rufescens TaxID=6454 RepID=UPI00201E7565
MDDDGDTILHIACLGGHVDKVRYVLLQMVADINSRGKYGRTPLMMAAGKGHRQVCDLLVREGADVSLVGVDRNNILHMACLGGHVDIVKYVLSKKVADINSRGQYWRTPLMMAAEKGHRQVFDLLVREGADVSLVDDDRNNILNVACIGGHVDIVKYVLSQKIADMNVTLNHLHADTDLYLACKKGYLEQLIRIFYKYLVDVKSILKYGRTAVMDDDGDTILHIACLGGHVDKVRYVLLQMVADINSRGKYGRTPVMMAAGKGHRQVFDLLVRKGADVSLVDDDGNNILHVACLGGHVDIVKYVLSKKVADINSRGQYWRTPLMMAAEKGHRQVFDLLVREGADVSLVDDDRNNILNVACIGGHVDIVKYVLSQKIADMNVTLNHLHADTDLYLACKKGYLDWLRRILFKYRVDVKSRLKYGRTPVMDDDGDTILHVACLGGHVDKVRYVLLQMDVDINSRGKYGRTPLMEAAEKGHRQVFDLLVRKGADVSLVDDDGNNILHVACLGGHVDIVKYVISKKVADINSRGQYWRTPLMMAAEKGHRQVFDLLVREGADVSLVDDDRNNILNVACIGGHVDIVKYVLSQKIADMNVTLNHLHADTDLYLACKKGYLDWLRRILFKYRVDVKSRLKYGRTPVMDDDGDTILHVACLGGHVDKVKNVLLQMDVDINSRGQYGRTPLMEGAEKGHRQVFDLLVREGADVSLVDDNGSNILHVACLGGHVDIVKYVLSQKVSDMNGRGQYGRTPLMVAAEKGHRQVFDLLVREGADVSLVDDDGNNILHMACIGGHVDMVKYVLSQRVADINSRGQYGRTPLMVAAEKGHRQVFDLLVRGGADVSLVGVDRKNILHVACLGGHVDMVKYVLSQKVADMNGRGTYGRTPVMMAAEKGHRQVCDLLVREGADVSLVGVDRNNILHMACLGGHVDIVKYVLSKKVADINSRGQYWRTPLMMAAEKGHRQVFDLLVREGADVSLVDDDRNNILNVACIGGHVDIVKYVLSQKIADMNVTLNHLHADTDLYLACKKGYLDWLRRILFKYRVDVKSRLKYGRTPVMDDDGDTILHVACLGGHVDKVRYVLLQMDVDINSRGKYGRTPLMEAAEKGHRQVFDLLVRKGADVSLVDDDGNNILHVACLGGHVDIVKYVISKKVADINSRGQYWRTPLMMAAEKGHRQVFDLLVREGADVSLVDDDRNNILNVACIGGHVDIVKYVLSQKIADMNVTLNHLHADTDLYLACKKGYLDWLRRILFKYRVDVKSRLKYGRTPVMDDDGDTILHVACLGGHVDKVKNVLLQMDVDINSRGQYGRTPL